jgi:DNA mismatch repair protein MSH6
MEQSFYKEEAQKYLRMNAGSDGGGGLLRDLLTVGKGCPQFIPVFEKIASSFDRNAAKKDRTITPEPGVSKEYDDAKAQKKELDALLNNHLTSVRELFKSQQVVYVKSGKDDFVLEVPKDVAGRLGKLPPQYVQKKGTQKVERYHTQFIIDTLPAYKEAEVRLSIRCLLRDIWAQLMNVDAGGAGSV